MSAEAGGTAGGADGLAGRPSGFPVAVPFPEWLGARIESQGPGVVRIGLSVDAGNMVNSRGVAHGGVVMTLLDVAMALAARSAPEMDGEAPCTTATIEMKTSFLRAGRGHLRADARCVHRTRSLAFCEAEIIDSSSDCVARASGTFKYFRSGGRG